jgi:peptide/nickel transport system permease protein
MLKVVWQRLLMLVLVLACVSIATFLMARVVPGDPAQVIAGPHASHATVQAIRHQLGMDQPILVQYADYMNGLLHGDLGTSITTRHPVSDDLLAYFPATLELVFYAFVVALVVGIPLAILAAVKRNSIFDYAARIVSLAGLSMPTFWFGLVLILVLYGKLGVLPSSGRLSSSLPPPPHITGLYTVDGPLTGYWATFVDSVKHLILPVLALAYVQLAIVVRQLRASMISVLATDYVRTARAAGLSEWTVITRFGLRNALVPVLTIVGISFGALLGGAVVTETVFGWPGMGNYVVQSIESLDFPAIMGFTIVIATAYVLINLVVDLINIALNPEIRRGGAS